MASDDGISQGGPQHRYEDSDASAKNGYASHPPESIDRIVERQIIPRLLVASSDTKPRTCAGTSSISARERDAFAPLPLDKDAAALLDEVDRFLQRGVPIDAIFLDLLAPSARALGEYWERDECDFVDVTMGLWRLQEVMREVALRAPPVRRAMSAPRSILLAPMPGEQHSFGTVMLEEMFARDGWQTELMFEPSRAALLDQVAGRGFDLVGLTISCDCTSAAVTQIVTAIRTISPNPEVRVLIGGRTVINDPELVEASGADGTAADARGAIALADRLIEDARLERTAAE